jgi:hypothetical protein
MKLKRSQHENDASREHLEANCTERDLKSLRRARTQLRFLEQSDGRDFGHKIQPQVRCADRSILLIVPGQFHKVALYPTR